MIWIKTFVLFLCVLLCVSLFGDFIIAAILFLIKASVIIIVGLMIYLLYRLR